MTTLELLDRCTDHHSRPRHCVRSLVRETWLERSRGEGFDPGTMLLSRRQLADGELRLIMRDECVLAVGLLDGDPLAVDVTDELRCALD